MAVRLMANAQLGVSCFERNGISASNSTQFPSLSYGLSISRRPIFGIALNTKRAKHSWVSSRRTFNCRTISALSKRELDDRLVGGGFIENEFEFKPSFDEYLKAMESVRTGRKQKKDNLKGKDVLRTPLLERDGENAKTRKFEGHSRQKASKVLKEEGLSENSSGVIGQEGLVRGKAGDKERGSVEMKDGSKMELREAYLEKGFARNGQGSVRDELDGKDSYADVQVKRNLKGETTSGRWYKGQISSVNKVLKESRFGKGVRARSVQERSGVLEENSLGMLEKKVLYGSQRDYKLKGETFEIVKHGLKSSEMHKRQVRSHAQGEKCTDRRIALKNGTFSRSTKASREKGDDNFGIEGAAFKTFDVNNDVLDKPRVSRMEMEERIQKLAKWLNGADIDMPEWMFSKMMRSAKIRFTDHSILRVIQILGKLGNWRRVLQVIEWLQMRERFKSHKLRYIYTAALDVLGKARRPVEALNVFHVMQQQMSSYPDLVAYHCIAVTLGQAGHMKELFDVIDCMRSPPKKKFKKGPFEEWDPRLEPDIIVYNAVLNACVRRKQWEGAFWVLQQLKQQGQQPSSTTYGLVMEVMFACGKYNLVHEFFRKVQKSSIPNALTYKVLVNTLWREGKTDEAVLAVQDMERRGIVGSAALYYDLARCLCSAERCQEALGQIEKICKVANKPLVVTYTGLIQACLDSGNIQNGAYIFRQMHGFCSPNLVTYNIMLKAYLEHGMFEEAKKLFQKMSEDVNCISSKSDYRDMVVPDTYSFNTMLDACISEKRWDDFEYFYKQMLHHGYHFNGKRHLRMILDASRSGKGELLETTCKHLAQADRILPLSLTKERFCINLEKDDYAAAISCITSHPTSELQALTKVAWLNLFKENAHRFHKDTLDGLIHEVSILTVRGDLLNPVFQNLIASCKEFLRTHMTVAESNLRETGSTVHFETALKS
ncbi:hypothetical protein L1049_010434 [Liquidambar formosana]|uniref:Pentatricopeptide repeat-containing protein n=1 Tax=Liquidambar formosana TaxID=63359 RepID=A0AAP0N9U4_LIQFO